MFLRLGMRLEVYLFRSIFIISCTDHGIYWNFLYFVLGKDSCNLVDFVPLAMCHGLHKYFTLIIVFNMNNYNYLQYYNGYSTHVRITESKIHKLAVNESNLVALALSETEPA